MTHACYVQASNRLSPGLAFWPIGCDGSDTTWLPRLGPEKPGSFFLSLWKHSLWEHVLWGHQTSCEMSETTDVRKCKWPHGDAMWREAGIWVAPSGASRPDRGTTPGNREAFWMSSPVEAADDSSSSCNLPATTRETPQENRPAEPSQTTEPWAIMIKCGVFF